MTNFSAMDSCPDTPWAVDSLPALILLLSMTSYCMKYPIAQIGLAVQALSPLISYVPPDYSLVEWCGKWKRLCVSTAQQRQKYSLNYQNSFHHKPKT